LSLGVGVDGSSGQSLIDELSIMNILSPLQWVEPDLSIF